jgi:hypothetical protein
MHPMHNRPPPSSEWRWRYSLLTGIMYGPVPVGVIVVVVAAIVYVAATVR